MKIDIVVPRMGESISEAIIGNILKENSSVVQTDDEILELETDKVNQVVYAPKKGILNLSVKKGDKVDVGAILGFIETEGQTSQPTIKDEKKEQPLKKEPPKELPSKESLRFTPDQFIQEFQKKPKSETISTETRSVPQESTERETRQIMPSIRKVIAKRLVAAQQETAMLTTFNEVDMTEVIELRKTYQEEFQKKHGVKLGFMSFFVKAVVSGLHTFPHLNSYLDGEEIVQRHYYDLGIAVSTEKGLLVPVIRNCDQLTVPEIERALENYAKKAREGRIALDDLHGGGFTITNGGVFGSLLSTPILNPPQCGILGMHQIQKRPVAINDQVHVRSMMYLALSYDHRLIDGKEAVSFLIHVKNIIENPARQLLEV